MSDLGEMRHTNRIKICDKVSVRMITHMAMQLPAMHYQCCLACSGDLFFAHNNATEQDGLEAAPHSATCTVSLDGSVGEDMALTDVYDKRCKTNSGRNTMRCGLFSATPPSYQHVSTYKKHAFHEH